MWLPCSLLRWGGSRQVNNNPVNMASMNARKHPYPFWLQISSQQSEGTYSVGDSLYLISTITLWKKWGKEYPYLPGRDIENQRCKPWFDLVILILTSVFLAISSPLCSLVTCRSSELCGLMVSTGFAGPGCRSHCCCWFSQANIQQEITILKTEIWSGFTNLMYLWWLVISSILLDFLSLEIAFWE